MDVNTLITALDGSRTPIEEACATLGIECTEEVKKAVDREIRQCENCETWVTDTDDDGMCEDCTNIDDYDVSDD